MNVTIGFPTPENLYKLKITSLAQTLSVQESWIEFGTLGIIIDPNECYHWIPHPRKPLRTQNYISSINTLSTGVLDRIWNTWDHHRLK